MNRSIAMIRHIVLSSSLVLAMGACQQGSSNATAPAAAATLVIQPPHVNTCPASTFDAFFRKFADDVAIQKAYVTDPMQSDSVDAEAEPEPAPVHKSLRKAEVEFPVISTTAELARKGLTATTEHPDASDISVTIAKLDADDQQVFHFHPSAGCWMLYRIDDQSL